MTAQNFKLPHILANNFSKKADDIKNHKGVLKIVEVLGDRIPWDIKGKGKTGKEYLVKLKGADQQEFQRWLEDKFLGNKDQLRVDSLFESLPFEGISLVVGQMKEYTCQQIAIFSFPGVLYKFIDPEFVYLFTT
jgi:hypothetical protein